MKLFEKKGRSKKEQFEIDEEVRVQDLRTGDWKQIGIITGIRTANDGQILSYTLRLNGHDTSRHRKFLKKILTRADADILVDEETGADEDTDDRVTMEAPRPSHGPIPADSPVSSRLRSRARLAKHSAIAAPVGGGGIAAEVYEEFTEFTKETITDIAVIEELEVFEEFTGFTEETNTDIAVTEELTELDKESEVITYSRMVNKLPSCGMMLCSYSLAVSAVAVLFISLYATECRKAPMVEDTGENAATVLVK